MRVNRQQQTMMNHTVDTCPLTKIEGKLHSVNDVKDDTQLAGNHSDDHSLFRTNTNLTIGE